jgi:hypothetical protein
MSAVVYRNPEFHLTPGEVDYEVWEYHTYGHHISDACAQTIASWWHSPASPNSTRLSTMGVVMDDTSIYDFTSQGEYDEQLGDSREQLDALSAYIQDKQKVKN